jgi:alkane 1-monooxygenase
MRRVPLEMHEASAQHHDVTAAFLGIFFLAFFALSPLAWAAMGMPWLTLCTFFLIRCSTLPSAHRSGRRGNTGARTVDPAVQLPLQAVLLVQGIWMSAGMEPLHLIVFAVAVGAVTGGMGITIAHELAHRPSRLDRLIAKALLVSVCYGHFTVEHIRGHHVRVGTPEDPATAPRGMNVYRFFVRSIVGSFAHAWKLEAIRLAHCGRSAWHPANWTLTGSVLSILLALVAGWWGGTAAVLLFVVQAVVAIGLLEIINYIEHYGLQRRRVDGLYEPVHERHSWNADFTVSNWILFNLQLHSDHHTHMRRPYEQLRSAPDAPQLPAGYPAMLMLALVPPLWFAAMDRRIPPPAAIPQG